MSADGPQRWSDLVPPPTRPTTLVESPPAAPTVVCTRCHGDNYYMKRAGEIAHGVICECVGACEVCNGAGWVPSDPKVKRSPRRPCACRRMAARIARLNEVQIPARHSHCTVRNWLPVGSSQINARARIETAVRGFKPEDRGVILWGGVGLGKTHLLCAFLRAMVLQHGASARFVEFSHLLADLKTGFDRGEGTGKLIDELVGVDVLGIDEIGKGRGTEFEGTILDEIVSRRYNAARPIFGTTNFFPEKVKDKTPEFRVDTLAERVGPRIFSRFEETADFVRVDGEDHRTKARSEALHKDVRK